MDAVVVAVLVVKLVAVAVEFIEQHPQQARPSIHFIYKLTERPVVLLNAIFIHGVCRQSDNMYLP